MAPSPHAPRRLRLVVLASGTATMALQMCAVRLLAPHLGASSVVWATVIGLSLLAMSIGYVVGGRLADRRANGRALAATLLAAAVVVALIPAIAPLMLPHATLGIENATGADLVGSLVGYGALFLVPAVLLGITPPYAIRLTMPRVIDAGRTAGRLYALSTVGSIVGTLLTALLLVQWIGTRATLWSIAGVLVVAAVLARTAAPVVPRSAPERQSDPAHARSEAGPIGAGLASTIVLVEGAAMMATEMSVARLVAPFFGASHVVWAVIIATVMGSIALGSAVGGRRADRHPTLPALVTVLSLSALAIAVLPFVTSPIMRTSTGGIDDVAVGTVVAAFVGTLIALVVPVTMLGMIPPWVLRLAVTDVPNSGASAGRLYALSTLGALIGTFASVLWLIPEIGTRRTMLAFAAGLALLALTLRLTTRDGASLGGRALAVPGAAVLAIALLFAAPTGFVKPLDADRVLAEEESRYQFIQVVEDEEDGRRLLQLNEGWAVHSIWDPDTVLTGGIWDHFLVLPALVDRPEAWDDHRNAQDARREMRNPAAEARAVTRCGPSASCAAPRTSDSTAATRFLVIGNAAGTSRRAYRLLRPEATTDGVELDTTVTRVGRRWFELEGDVIAADGRPFLERTKEQWDVIHVDAYRQPYIPFYLTTREFFVTARERLRPGGVLSINVGSTPEDPRINEAVAATMRSVFPLVARYRAEAYNEVIVAMDDEDVQLEELRARVRASDLSLGDSPVFFQPRRPDEAAGSLTAQPLTGPAREDLADEREELGSLFAGFAEGMREVQPDPSRVLTDDRAPVEWMTDRMIFGAAG